MVAGVGGRKAGALRTVVHQHPHLIGKIGITTGPETEKHRLDDGTAEQIADDDGHDQRNSPPATARPEIVQRKHEQKQIKKMVMV